MRVEGVGVEAREKRKRADGSAQRGWAKREGGEREKERKRRKRRRWKEERENDRGTQRALVLLTGR